MTANIGPLDRIVPAILGLLYLAVLSENHALDIQTCKA